MAVVDDSGLIGLYSCHQREEPMTSAATLAITACTDLIARPDASNADLIAARTVVWRAEDAAETEAERLACRAAGAAVSEALEAAYTAREVATVARTFLLQQVAIIKGAWETYHAAPSATAAALRCDTIQAAEDALQARFGYASWTGRDDGAFPRGWRP